MQYITLDGPGGAGKTTQQAALAKALNMECYPQFAKTYQGYLSLCHACSRHTPTQDLLCLTMALHSIPIKKPFIIERFWSYLQTCLNSHQQSDNFENNLDLIHAIMNADGCNPPTLSIYLDVEKETSLKRVLNRDFNGLRAEIKVTERTKERKSAQREYYEQLISSLPHFHIVDGTQPAETITETIITLYKGVV